MVPTMLDESGHPCPRHVSIAQIGTVGAGSSRWNAVICTASGTPALGRECEFVDQRAEFRQREASKVSSALLLPSSLRLPNGRSGRGPDLREIQTSGSLVIG